MTERKKKLLLLLLGGIFMLGMMGVSLLSFTVSRASLHDQVMENTLPQVGNTVYSEIQRDLLKPIFISSAMADNTFVHDWVNNGEKDIDQIARYLAKIKNEHQTLTAFFVSEKTRNYHYPDGILKQVKEGDSRDDWYFRVRDMSAEHEINIDPDLATDDTITVFVNYRIVAPNGDFLGAIGIGLAIESISTLVEQYSQSYNRVVYFIDNDGAYTIGLTPHGSARSISQVEGLSELSGTILSSRGEVADSYRSENSTTFLNSRYIEELDWHLMVEQPEALMQQAITKTLIANLLASFVFASVFLWLAHRVLFAYRRDLEAQAIYDQLTGVYNRYTFEQMSDSALKHSARKSDQLSIMFIDIDHFKRINDLYGHMEGDKALLHVAQQITHSVRENDVTCRWGGEEFCVLLRGCSATLAMGVAEKVRRAVESSSYTIENNEVSITVSIGIAEANKGETLTSVLSRSDEALYEAKNSGRNQVKLASHSDAMSTSPAALQARLSA